MIPIPGCDRCKLAQGRKRIISSFGPTPAQVLLVTDTPNKTDEMFGRPLAGPDAKVFRDLLREASAILGKGEPTLHIVSLILCRAHTNNVDRPAQKAEILNCMENIITIKEAVQPSLVVLMGDYAKMYYGNEFEDPVTIQPCWLIRKHPGLWINAVTILAEGLRRC